MAKRGRRSKKAIEEEKRTRSDPPQIVFRSFVKRAEKIAKDKWQAGLEAVAGPLQKDIQQRLGRKKYPPASRPGQSPAKRSGNLQGGITVEVEPARRGRAAALVVLSDRVYGSRLERPTDKGGMNRPYAKKALLTRDGNMKRKWTRAIVRAAKGKQ